MPLETIGHYSAIGSFVVAIIASFIAVIEYISFKWRHCKKRKSLEIFLQDAFNNRGKSSDGLRTMLLCKSELNLTEDEITNIVFRSPKLKFYRVVDRNDKKVVSLLVGDVRCEQQTS